MNAAAVAASPDHAADRLTSLWALIDRSTLYGVDAHWRTAWRVANRGFPGKGSALCSSDPLTTLIDSIVSEHRIEDLPVETVIVATDLLVGQPKLLRWGPLALALQATMATPGMLSPIQIDGITYVDGAISANVPIRQALAAGAKSIIVLDANPSQMPGFVPPTPWEAVVQATRVMMTNQLAGALDDLANHHPVMRLPKPTPPALSPFDFSQTADLVEAGFNSTKQFLGDFEDLADTNRSI